MRRVEISARTVDEAIRLAAEQLDTEVDNLEIEILEEPSKGFLGILGGKQAKISATLKEGSGSIDSVTDFLTAVTNQMGFDIQVSRQDSEQYTLLTLNGNNLGNIIGRRGETLDALQYLTNLVAYRQGGERKKIILDAEGYRKRREKTLNSLARRLAERVKKSGNPVVLEPMNPQERRVIHTALQNDSEVQTLSEGQEPYRKVVISLRDRY